MATLPTFEELETSIDSGRPVEYFRFTLNGATWYYCTADKDQDFGGAHWTAAAIESPTIQQTGEYVNDAVTMNVPSWIAPAQLFMTSAPTFPIQVTIGCKHVDSDDIVIGYIGEILQVNFPFPGRAVITCESLAATMRREGLRLGWQRSCPYVLYDPVNCKVDKALWKIDFTTLSIDGFTIDVELATTKPDHYFDNGFIEWLHPIRVLELLAIVDHTVMTGEANARFTLFGPPGELFEGALGSVYPACNFTPTNCQAFGNYDNYGGVPDMPGKSPFDGDPVF